MFVFPTYIQKSHCPKEARGVHGCARMHTGCSLESVAMVPEGFRLLLLAGIPQDTVKQGNTLRR